MNLICAILAGIAWYTGNFGLLCLACILYFLLS